MAGGLCLDCPRLVICFGNLFIEEGFQGFGILLDTDGLVLQVVDELQGEGGEEEFGLINVDLDVIDCRGQ